MKHLLLILFFFTLGNFSFSQKIKLVDLNIRYDNPQDGENAWSKRKETTIPWLIEQNADLFFFQEVLYHQFKDLSSALYNYNSYGIGREDGDKQGELSPIFFNKDRFEGIEQFTYWLSPTPLKPSKGWDAACERIATVLLLKDIQDNDTILCINTHWDHVGKVAQDSSAQIIINIAKRFKVNDIIIAGDFNVNANHSGIKKIEESFNLIEPKKLHNTYHGFSNQIYTDQKPIDLLFISPSFKATKVKYIRQTKENKFISDHDAMIAEINRK